MTATLLYRISAFVLVLFAAGHTLGFMKFKAPTPEGIAVQQAMDNVRFNVGGKNLTYGDFYRGFGLFCTAYLLFGAFLAWHLGDMARSTPQAIGALGWVFFGLQVVGIVLSWRYFYTAANHIFPCAGGLDRLGSMAGWRVEGMKLSGALKLRALPLCSYTK
jgi:hypothetical protein